MRKRLYLYGNKMNTHTLFEMKKIEYWTGTGYPRTEELGEPRIWKYNGAFLPKKGMCIGDVMRWESESEAIEFAADECTGSFVIVSMLGYYILIENAKKK